MAGAPAPAGTAPTGVRGRDLDQDQHDPAAGLGTERPASEGVCTAWALAHPDLPGGGLRHDGLSAPCVFDGPINGRSFHAWVEQYLVPTLKPGDIVILDNLASHKGKAVRQAIRTAGARLWFLPPYSPDLNPIEQTFAKIKHWMRDAQKRTVEDTWRHLGDLLGTIEPHECQNYIRNAGYGSM